MARIERRFDFSGGMQTATSWLLRKSNEVALAINARFNNKLGALTRRRGYSSASNVLQANKSSLGLHEAKFSTGSKIYAATNNSGDTATQLKTLNTGTGAWSAQSMPNTIDPNTQLSMIDSLDEMYVAGKSTSTGVRMSPVNIKKDGTASASRNLVGCPACMFLVEFGGALYAINCTVNGTDYPDRAYRSSQALGAITYVQGVQVPTSTSSFVVLVDSVRYLKTSLALDLYQAGTDNALRSNVTPSAVDKSANTITITPTTGTFASTDVNTTTDVITVGSTIGAAIVTGRPISFTAGTTIPTGLTAGTVYYAIKVSSTTIKVATSYANAIAGTAVDITGAGSGTNTIYLGFNDNDEIWGTGRKGELAYYWNTDYPTTEDADFLHIPPGLGSDDDIIGYGKSNNRLFLFTKSAVLKWDNQNLVTVYPNVGLASFDSLQYVGDDSWMLWLDQTGRIRAYNDATGQREIISRAVWNDWLENVPTANAEASAASVDRENVYKLWVGNLTLNKRTGHWRFCYDFDGNDWWLELHTRGFTKSLNSDFGGSMATYFFDDTAGKLYKDNDGNLDDTATIPMFVQFGRSNDGVELEKAYHGIYVFGTAVTGAEVKIILDNGDPVAVGELTGYTTKIALPRDVENARDIDFELTHNGDGDAPEIEGIATYYDPQEDKFA